MFPRNNLLLLLLLLALAFSTSASHAGVVPETHDLITFEYQQTGANEEEAVRLACIRAVHATLGRLLFSDYSLQARDLIEPYIQKNWAKFVASSYVLERRFERDGFGARIRVQTFPQLLTRDLREKRFLYMPRPNPYHYVFFSQAINQQRTESELARRAAIDTLLSDGDKVYESGIQVPPNSSDVLADPAIFAAAREAAQRIGAEIIIAGRADTRKVGQREELYNLIHTYETVIHIEMIRSDDGSRMGAVDLTERASDADETQARNDSIQSGVDTAIKRLLRQTRGIWRTVVADRSKFSILLTDVSPEEMESVSRHLEMRLGSGSAVRVRSFFSNVAILSVNTERAYAVVERAVQDYKPLNLLISDKQGHRIVVDVHR